MQREKERIALALFCKKIWGGAVETVLKRQTTLHAIITFSSMNKWASKNTLK